jgi:midasin (ATPase involved in ribosome maturation)
LLRVLDQLDFRNCHSLLEDDSVDLMDLNLTCLCFFKKFKIKLFITKKITFSVHHLSELSNLRNSLQFDAANKNVRKMRSFTTKALNVYQDSDPSALVQCLDILALLQHRSLELLTEFPENAQLLQLTQSIDAFVHKAPAGAPLMKQAAQLERILGENRMRKSIFHSYFDISF